VRAEIVKINSEKPEASLIRYAAEQIRAGEILGMPTDTFYGLAADPFNLRAVERVYEIKSRSRHKPLSLLIESVDQAEELARPLPKEFYELARKFWPGPLTVIVKAAPATQGYCEHRKRRATYSQFQDRPRGDPGCGYSNYCDFGESEWRFRMHHGRRGAGPAARPHRNHCRRRNFAAGRCIDHHRSHR